MTLTRMFPAVIEEVTPTGTVRYFRTPDGALIARSKGSEWRFYHYDELGSTRLLTDGSGSVTDRYSYDAYGSVTSHIGSTTDNPYQYIGALGYYTHYQDPDFGLLQLGVRFYEPGAARFTQPGSPYTYALDRPTDRTDQAGGGGTPSAGDKQEWLQSCQRECEAEAWAIWERRGNRSCMYRLKWWAMGSACGPVGFVIGGLSAATGLNPDLALIHETEIATPCDAYCRERLANWERRHGQDPKKWPSLPDPFDTAGFDWWYRVVRKGHGHVIPVPTDPLRPYLRPGFPPGCFSLTPAELECLRRTIEPR